MPKHNNGSGNLPTRQPHPAKRNDGGGAPGPKYPIPCPPKPKPKKK